MKKLIVRMPNWIGDVVMSLPVLQDLKRKYPDIFLSVLIKENLKNLLDYNPYIDEIIDFKDKKEAFDKIDKKYENGLLLTNSFSSSYLFYKAKIKSFGYRKDFRSFLLKKSLDFPKDKTHQIDKYKRLLTLFDIERTDEKPKLFLNEKERDTAINLIKSYGIKDINNLIGINPTAAFGSAKCWPIDRYQKLSLKLVKLGYTILVFADKKSKEKVDPYFDNIDKSILNLSGRTDLKELINIISFLRLFITNDSGPMHIASALKIPLIAIFGSTCEISTGPYYSETIIKNKVECSPCFKRKCPIDFRCMMGISHIRVFEKVKEMLS